MFLRLLLYTFYLLFSNVLFSQNFNLTDSIVDNYPKDINNEDKLISLINTDFINKTDKVRAVFRWITTNISYDVELSELMDSKTIQAFKFKNEKEKEVNEKKFKSILVTNTMISKKAVCHGYAVLIEDLCQKLGIEAKTILGNLKSDPSQIGVLPTSENHAWNVVKINDKWQFIDATLAAGFVSSKTDSFKFYFNDSYFFTNPEDFFLNHYPSDEKWLFVKKTKNEFAQLPIFFGYYFQYKYKIIKPEIGFYSISENKNFTFKISGLSSTDYVEFSLNSENKLNYLTTEDNSKDFLITLNDKLKEDYLSIFVNRRVILVYKIIN